MCRRTVQRILRHSSITVTTGTYVEVIEAVKRDALDSMATLFETGWRRFVRPVVVNEAAVVVTVVVKTLESPTRKTAIFLVELRGLEPLRFPAKTHCEQRLMFDDIVTSPLAVLRICVGVLRDVTVLIRVSGDRLAGTT